MLLLPVKKLCINLLKKKHTPKYIIVVHMRFITFYTNKNNKYQDLIAKDLTT